MAGAKAGELVTGALVADTVEPLSGVREEPARDLCLNCGTALLGGYCHRCGQAGHAHRSLSAIWHDIAHGVLHFEGKIWNTLPLLTWRPGELTRRYIHGERARFVSPMALFLFSVFLMFALFSAIGATLKMENFGPRDPTAARQQVAADLARIDQEIVGAKAKGLPTIELEAERRAVQRFGTLAIGAAEGGSNKRMSMDANIGIPKLDKAIEKAAANPNLLLYKVQTNAYKFSWALIPISTPLLWLLFAWRRRFRFYDHAVFVTYSLAFMSLFAIVLTLLGTAGTPTVFIALAALIVPPWHIYRQMRGAYQLSRPNALLRSGLLLVLASGALLAYFTLLLALGALG